MSKKGFTYTLQIDAEINDLIAKTNTVKKSMESIMSAGKAPGAEKIFGSIERAIERLQQKAAQPIESVAAFSALEKDAAAVGVQLKKLGSVVESLGNMSAADKMDLLPPDLKKQIEDASAALVTFSKAQAQAAQKSQALIDAENDLAAAQKELKKAEGRVQEKQALIQAQQALVDGAHNEANAIKAKIDALKKYQATAAAYDAAGGDKRKAGGGKEELAGLNLPADRTAAKKAAPGLDLGNSQAIADEITRLGDAYSQASKAVTDAESTQRRYSKQLNEANNAAAVASSKVTALQQSVTQLNQEFEKDKAKNVQAAYTKLRTEAGKLGVDLKNIPIDYTEQNLIELNNAMNKLAADGIAQVDQGLNTIEVNMEGTGAAADNLGSKMTGAAGDVNKLDAQVSQTQAFTQRIAQFVGLQGGIEIARSAMRNAISTIKELDKAMTEMAVVTDLGVGDYWDQLPQHTERANALGMSIKSVYEAETLYYQQGLKTNAVVEMSTETLKMARIAGLSAEDATNKMTAALRGFNMELNETSAQRIADVYSELAAITASDVDEISSAMTKTASIAASAGMEFETTAAFLSQIIETTRESAETAGTAMKTVIARFQELKKDPAEIGEVDGEVVDANKIETALRSVGVALRDSSGQFRELDEVFLELSSKWADLDTNTQRYIATIAAGSRQQSRFIAMMSDYSRTQELVTAANSSAGASNEQFEKTMDSLESKLAELKNAWDSFTMGIMDSEILKTGIDLLTGILTVINNITDAFGDFSGAAKIGLLIAALYLGDKALKVFTTSIQKGSTIFGAFGKVGKTALSGIQSKLTSLNKLVQITFGKKGINVGFSKETIARSKKDLTAYTDATRKHASAKAMMNNLENKGATDTALYAKVSQRAADAEKERVAVEGNLMTALGLNEAQMAATTAMTAMGVSADKAAILAKAGISAQNLAAAVSYSGLSAAQVGAQLAAKLENASIIRVLSTKIALTVANWAQTASNTAETGTLWAKVTATIAQTMANWGLQASMWPILVVGLLIIAALAVLIGLIMAIVALVKWFNANSPEGKLKSAEEAADAAAEAAERTAQAYNDLVDAVESLSDQYDGLENLTRGTKEWKEAVKEVNAEVLDLIEKYPELAGLVENKNGVLTLDIESKEVQDVLEKYENKAAQSSAASYAAKINVNEKKAAVRANEVNSNKYLPGVYVSNGDSGYYQKLTQETLKAVSQAMASGDIYDKDGSGSMTEEISDWLASNGTAFEQMHADTFAAQLNKATEELKEFGNELNTMNAQDQVMYEQMAQDAINTIDASKFTEDQLKQMDVAATADYSKAFNDASQAELEKAIDEEGKNSETFKNAKEEVAKNLYGEDATVSGNKITYTDENGDEQTKKLTDEEFKEQWAAIDATRNMTEAFEQLPKTIDKISSIMTSEAGKAFKAMYGGKDGSAMTKADIEAASATTEGDLWTVWTQLTEEERKAFGSFEIMLEQYNDSLEASQAALEQAQEASNAAGIKLMDGVSMEAARGYAEQMRNVYLMNEEASKDLSDQLEKVVGTLDEVDKTKFVSTLNALDWQSVESLETLPETLEEIGVSVPQDELETYIDMLKQSNGALRKIDLNKLRDAATELTNLKGAISSGEQGRSLSEEAYNSLKEMAPELAERFQLGLDGQYVYLGQSMADLTEAIEANTSALLAEATKELDNRLAMSELTTGLTQTVGNRSYSIQDMARQGSSFDSEEAQRNILKNFQQAMIQNKKEIVGIEGFGNFSSVDKLSGDELDNIIKQLAENSNNTAQYKEDYSKTAVEAAAVMYQGNSAVQNASGVDMNNTHVTKETILGGLKNLGNLFLGKEMTNLEDTYRHSDTYAGATQGQKNEFNARSNALMAQATQTGVSSTLVDEYAKVVDGYRQGAKAYSEVLKVQRELANSNDYLAMRNGLKGVFEMISGVKEEYDTIAAGDIAGKVTVANQALAKFGIVIDETMDPDKYMDILSQISQGNTAAMGELIATAQEQAGLAVDGVNGVGNAYTQGWENLTQAQIEFYDQMATANLGHWKLLEDGTRQFVWATVAEMESVAKAAGTAEEAWENPYTWLYNYNEEITRLTREREKAERDYTKALEDETVTAKELLEISQQQLSNLEAEAKMHATGAGRAMDEIQSQFAANSKFSEYVTYDPKTSEILIDYEKLDSAGFDEETGEKFEEFLSVIEENRDVILDAEEALCDIEDQIQEIKERGKEETSEMYNQIKEGLIQSRQKEIDELQAINDSVQEASATLVEQIQKQIEEARQARENEKTENDIADKETRLAYLMRDTSGGNAMEIAQLQKEIAEQKEGYTDSLVDQQLQSLQDANEQAAQQRQQQIDLAQAQLDAYANGSAIWQEVQDILLQSQLEAQASEEFSTAWMETSAAQYIAMSEGIDSLNPIEKEIATQSMLQNAALSLVYSGIGDSADKTQQELTKNKTAIDTVKTSVKTLGSADIKPGITSITKGAGTNTQSIVKAISGMEISIKNAVTSGGSGGSGGASSGKTGASSGSSADWNTQGGKLEYTNNDGKNVKDQATVEELTGDKLIQSKIRKSNAKFNYDGNNWNWEDMGAGKEEDGSITITTDDTTYSVRATSSKAANGLAKHAKAAGIGNGEVFYYNGGEGWDSGWYLLDGDDGSRAGKIKLKKHEDKLKKYKTGGLADYTGPAWLDGTKSSPELVLNATDTANFILLKDILAEILEGTSSIGGKKEQKGGDNYYDVEITVENISDDYDVEQMAEKIKSMIYEDSIYRNVNSINNIR